MSDVVVPLDPSAEQAPAPPQTSAQPGTGVTIARNSLWMMLDSVAGMWRTLYISIVVARRLGPDFMGHYNYILWFATVLRMVTEVAIPATVRKFAAEFSGRGDYPGEDDLSRALRLQAKLLVVGRRRRADRGVHQFPHEQRMVATLAVLSIVPGLCSASRPARCGPPRICGTTSSRRWSATSSTWWASPCRCSCGWGLLGLTASLLISRVADCVFRFVIFPAPVRQLPGKATARRWSPSFARRMIRFAAQQLVLTALYALLFDRMEIFFLRGRCAHAARSRSSRSPSRWSTICCSFPQNLRGAASASMWVQQGRSPEEAAHTAATATWFIMICRGARAVRRCRDQRPASCASCTAQSTCRRSRCWRCLPVRPQPGHLPAGAVPAGGRRAPALLSSSGCGRGRRRRGRQPAAHPALRRARGRVRQGGQPVVAAAGFLTYMVVTSGKLPIARMIKLLLAATAMFFVVRAGRSHFCRRWPGWLSVFRSALRSSPWS